MPAEEVSSKIRPGLKLAFYPPTDPQLFNTQSTSVCLFQFLPLPKQDSFDWFLLSFLEIISDINLFFVLHFLNLKTFFNWRIIALQNFVVFCHTSPRISHRYMHVPCLPDLPLSSLPTRHPSPCCRAPVWVPWVIQQIPIGYLSYTWYCKFLCYSLHTSPLPSPLLPPCPEVCSLCLFLHCCPENKFMSAISSDSINMCQYMIFIFLFLTYFTL